MAQSEAQNQGVVAKLIVVTRALGQISPGKQGGTLTRGIRTRIAPIELGTANGIRISILLETGAVSNGYGFSSTPARGRRAGSGHLSSGVVSVAQFNPWQAHVIVVDTCASRAGRCHRPHLSDVKVAKSVGQKSEIFGVE